MLIILTLVPSPPVINTVSDNITSTVRVTWNRPTELNGVLVSYTVSYDINGGVMTVTVVYNGEEVGMCTIHV